MTSSGIEVVPDVKTKFSEIKKDKKHKYVIFKISEDLTQIVVHSTRKGEGDKLKDDNCQKCWEELCATLKEKEPCYIVYDVHNVTKNDKRPLTKLILISWCSDHSEIKYKMLHASSEDALKKNLDGIAGKYQAHDRSDLAYSDLLEIAQKGN